MADPTTSDPAKALDPIAGESSFLDKAREMAKPYMAAVDQTARPYVEKVTSTTRPYTDAAFGKAQELVEKMEGVPIAGSQTPAAMSNQTTGQPLYKGKEPEVGGIPSTATAGTGGDLGSQAKGMFEQVTSAVQSTFNQITHTIDDRTASPNHLGIITQVTNAVQAGVGKVDAFIEHQTTTAGAAASRIGEEGGSEIPAVQTKTNSGSQHVQSL